MLKKYSRISVLLLVLTVVVFIFSLWRRIIHIDDVWLAEYSYWLAKLGYVKSEAMRGFFNAENKLFVYHKLFHIEGAWLIRWFGFNAYILKSLSLLYVALSIPLLILLYRRHQLPERYLLLFVAIFLSFFHTMNLGFTFRPELHLVFWGLLSFIFLEQYLDTGKWGSLIFSAFVTGIGIATHLNGVVFTGAAVLYLWLQRRWWPGFVYGVIATWGLVFYFTYDVRSLEDLKLLHTQLTNWRDVATGKYGWELIFRIFEEQGRYLHSPPEIIYSVMLLLLLIPARRYLLEKQKRLLLYVGLLSLCVAEVTHGTNTNYLMYAFPFLILLAMSGFTSLLAERRQKLAWSAVLIFILGSLAYDISQFRHREQYASEYAKVARFLPEGAHVLSPAHLMFSGLGHQRIQSFINYRDKVEAGALTKSPEQLFAEALNFDIDYVVVDQSNKNFFNIQNQDYGRYKILATSPSSNFLIYQRQK